MVNTTPSAYLVLLASTCLLLFSNIATHTVEAKASHGGARDFSHIVDKRAPQAAAATTTLAPIRGGNTNCNNLGIPPLDAALISKVKANLAATGGDSWVSGTRCVCLFYLSLLLSCMTMFCLALGRSRMRQIDTYTRVPMIRSADI